MQGVGGWHCLVIITTVQRSSICTHGTRETWSHVPLKVLYIHVRIHVHVQNMYMTSLFTNDVPVHDMYCIY